jgi:RimJ/RimL family protein N-acetyltransferase
MAFMEYGLQEVVSFTTTANHRSVRVMEKIGMVRSESEDFDHPKVPIGHPLRRHILYRITKEQFGKHLSTFNLMKTASF